MQLTITLMNLDKDEIKAKLSEGPFPNTVVFELDVVKQEYEVQPGVYMLIIDSDGGMKFCEEG